MTKQYRRLTSLFLAILALGSLTRPAVARDDSHMEWWRDARYGMFSHWGLYSVAGGEWKGKDYGKEQGGASAEWLMNSAKIPGKEYRQTLTPQFNPADFDANEWVSIVKNAGMKYIVITSSPGAQYVMLSTGQRQAMMSSWATSNSLHLSIKL